MHSCLAAHFGALQQSALLARTQNWLTLALSWSLEVPLKLDFRSKDLFFDSVYLSEFQAPGTQHLLRRAWASQWPNWYFLFRNSHNVIWIIKTVLLMYSLNITDITAHPAWLSSTLHSSTIILILHITIKSSQSKFVFLKADKNTVVLKEERCRSSAHISSTSSEYPEANGLVLVFPLFLPIDIMPNNSHDKGKERYWIGVFC